MGRLVERAAFIVVYCDVLSPGRQDELNIICEKGREAATVIVISSVDRFMHRIPRMRISPGNIEMQNYEEIAPGHGALTPFSRVVWEHDISFDDLSRSPEFAALLRDCSEK